MTDLNKEREALIAQIEVFKKEAMELWFVPDLAESYKNMDMFSYSIVENNEVFFMREQARQLWRFWNKAKAQAVPDGYVVVPKVANKQMVNAGYEAHDGFYTNGQVQDVYQAMIKVSESGAEG
ncbi:hypothetical protein [Acinetobacter nosocomialis]|uniref:hypothetical protein n=1 Tax=Acinetobacter nosocomialis TaxID=106654 RepID=UPI00124E216B|nr:hypothetical protein [Acinetobacter nosocomialis]